MDSGPSSSNFPVLSVYKIAWFLIKMYVDEKHLLFSSNLWTNSTGYRIRRGFPSIKGLLFTLWLKGILNSDTQNIN